VCAREKEKEVWEERYGTVAYTKLWTTLLQDRLALDAVIEANIRGHNLGCDGDQLELPKKRANSGGSRSSSRGRLGEDTTVASTGDEFLLNGHPVSSHIYKLEKHVRALIANGRALGYCR